ncbi:MAG TPA: NAD-dependent epimerase [Methylotenera sp.]|nr:NAD-dependent epimerase [Methylotenera sp.]HPV45086.1 NAD-dependent epimerase [Methylotenera sp.]
MKVLLTGAAGFIGYHVAIKLLERGDSVVGVDNLNDYYDVRLKQARLSSIQAHPKANSFKFIKLDLAEQKATAELFTGEKPDSVIHLAAQAGVRYSLQNPHAYISSNIVAFTNILEACRAVKPQHLVYASSSSVYGGNTKLPFSETDNVDHPVSLYAATKKANELMAHTYSHLYGLPTTGLRFFTVYGPWGRPDMSPFLFADAILNNRPIKVFNHGDMMRDFTYIDDIVEGVVRVLDKPATLALNTSAPYRIFNIGNNQPVQLLDFIGLLEDAINIKAQKEFLPMQPGDVKATYADTNALDEWVGFKPCTPLQQGVIQFVDWYREFYIYR